jgi:hypothetical protein
VIDGLQIYANPQNGYVKRGITTYSGGDYATIKNSIIKTNGINSGGYSGIMVMYNGPYYVFNNIIYDWNNTNNYGIYSDVMTPSIAYVYNNTVYNSYYGFWGGGPDTVAKNNLANNNTVDYSVSGGNFNSSSTNNLSKDATAPAYGVYYRNKNVMFKDAANFDFHLLPADTAAKDRGANLSSDPYLIVIYDIDGDARPSTNDGYDIGADEVRNIEAPEYIIEGAGIQMQGFVEFQ